MGRLIGALTLLYTLAYTWAQEECKKGGCFPATGDLLVGRQHKLTATSTCGLNGPQQYCIVSFLDKNDKCFTCDSSNDRSSDTSYHPTSHLVKYVVSTSPKNRLSGWWQSGNGVQDVTIQLDLEVEFVFTHLIMTFKTFRPKAMYVERSWNYGREWSVYRYYAYDCRKSFPGISKGPQKNIDDVICEERYSRVEPSTEGEVVMKVLDPVIQRSEDPYSQRVQNLLKLTNLRIRFKELHTFGDDVLGDSPEVSRKYYYALYEMVVRGSCSCYGHAQRCISENGGVVIDNMVHGTCDCQHFTTGRNCEKCLPGYNDEPWRPAYKDQLSECRKCNCNEHTDKCHFDPAVYNATGHTSGGVCDDCQHNTAGRKCDHCKPLFYRDPFKDITDPDVCRPCDCDPAGSFGGGECETENVGVADAGRCICKQNVIGRRCDKCKDGFWNLLESNPQGCQSCKCDIRGTVERDTCDQKTGHCRCKRNVRGLTCSQCLEGYWNLGVTPKGCEECGCDPGGSRNFTCDDISGQCSCRANLIGRKCDRVRPGYHFANLDHNTYEAENAVPTVSGTPFEIVRKIARKDETVRWTGDGFLQVKQGSVITFPNVRVPETGDYNMVLRYDPMRAGDWTDVRLTVQKGNGGAMGGDGCPNDDSRSAHRYPIIGARNKGIHIDPSLCLQRGNNYKITLDFRHNNRPAQSATLIDSLVLLPKTDKLPIFDARNAEAAQRKQIYDEMNCRQYYVTANTAKDAPEACKKIQFSVSSLIHNGALSCQCHPVGTRSNGSNVLTCEEAGGQCPCKPGVTGRICDKCAPGYFGYGRNGCTKCDCDVTGSTSPFCHHITGKCQCLTNIQGRKCDSCPPFHYGFPFCRSCDCKRHSASCDPRTGVCSNCDHNTAGRNCERCADGYYGDATRGTVGDCQRCQCPGGSSGNQFSSSCILDVRTGRGICNNCTNGYQGNQCERCADGYYGNPLIAGGSCKKCDCSGNIDLRAVGKCNAVTGKCFDCLNNSTGDNCESCKPKFFGNARNQTCRPCVCKDIGTDPTKGGICDAVTGQCPCLLNIEGKQCDRCAAGFYGLASGRGCLECNCKKEGSLEGSCDQTTGQCKCRVGFGGRDCGECEDLSWGSPMNSTCVRCGCNPKGSLDLQCDRRTGKCKCKHNVIGDKCDMCKPRTAGVMPRCESCHTCNAQWEDIAVELEKKINMMLNFTRNITNFNTSGILLYNAEVDALRNQLRNMEPMFKQHKVSDRSIEDFMTGLREFRGKLGGVTARVKEFGDVVKNTTERTTDATKELEGINLTMEKLRSKAKEFKRNVTKMIEGNIGGAYNSTMESLRRSNAAKESVDASKKLIPQSKRKRKSMKREIINGVPTFAKLRQDNMDIADQIGVDLGDLERKLNELNMELCGAKCGACTEKGCSSCGAGPDCSGVKKMADDALKKAQEAQKAWEKKEISARELVKTIQEVEVQVKKTKTATFKALGQVESAKQIGEVTTLKILKLISDIKDFLDKKFNHPKVAKDLARETLALNISLTPEQVRALAEKIKKAVKDLKNVNKILKESEADLKDAMKLKEEALAAKKFAIEVMNKTRNILEKLAQTKALQKATTTTVTSTGQVVGQIAEVMRAIATNMQQAKVVGSEASANAHRVLGETDQLREDFRKNRAELKAAENQYARAKSKVAVVEDNKVVLDKKYNETRDKLNDKQQMLEDVLRRIAALNARAKKAVGDVSIKMTDLSELTKKYKSNEKATADLSRLIANVTIRAKFTRNRLQELSKCHATCNPAITGLICEAQLAKVQTEEAKAYAELKASYS